MDGPVSGSLVTIRYRLDAAYLRIFRRGTVLKDAHTEKKGLQNPITSLKQSM